MYRLFLLLILLAVLGCSQSNIPQPEVFPHRVDAEHVSNPVRIHDKVISGGLPESEAAFAELRDLGVKTVISVDGMTPDVVTAKKYGLRYVHLPHGYDGVPEERVKELAKAVHDLEGPIYIHCHHGKHRSPAAATVACVAAGLIPESAGVPVLELAGTSPHYRGLFQSVREVHPLDEALINELNVEFHETTPIPPMAEAMVAMELTHDHLNKIVAADWRTPEDHPALDPAHEALLMREHFTELLRTEMVRSEPEAFQKMLRDSESAALQLEAALHDWKPVSPEEVPPALINEHAAVISKNCKACHQQFRDVPLGEK
ncbi:protein-tyrosine phosphatase family protein [Calycomorphotria hydatis]|uniref:Cytochrome C n=1 Tax=Calycomorphotria hydatis TaxID=2528027 RepID=A0A517T3V8_9PLAN|nr:hypothetical protein [Calycomorphotria hydatis]QDT63063.1 hypothetical protein V22_02620 [Calycomorphotria hydatis]